MKKAILLTALDKVKPGLSKDNHIEQSNSFAFMDGRLATFNDEISVSYPLAETPFVGAVNADMFINLISKIKTEEIEFTATDNELGIKAGRAKAGMALQAEIKLPIMEELGDERNWKSIPEGFIEALDFSAGCCSKDTSKEILMCVHVNKKGVVEGSDGFRIAQTRFENKFKFESFLIPAKAIIQLLKLSPSRISVNESWVHFSNKEGVVFSCRTFADEYPQTEAWLKKEKGVNLKLPKNLLEMMDRAQVFYSRDKVLEERVDITVKDGKMGISAKNESGWFSESVKTDYKGKAFGFPLTPYLFRNILKLTEAAEVCENRIIIEKDNWIFVGALI